MNKLDLDDELKQVFRAHITPTTIEKVEPTLHKPIRCQGCDILVAGYIGNTIVTFTDDLCDDDYSWHVSCKRNEKIENILNNGRTE